jgi:hypothetical protein
MTGLEKTDRGCLYKKGGLPKKRGGSIFPENFLYKTLFQKPLNKHFFHFFVEFTMKDNVIFSNTIVLFFSKVSAGYRTFTGSNAYAPQRGLNETQIEIVLSVDRYIDNDDD